MAGIVEQALSTFGTVPEGVLGAAICSVPQMFTRKEINSLLATSKRVHDPTLATVVNHTWDSFGWNSRFQYNIVMTKNAARIKTLLDFGADTEYPSWCTTYLHSAIFSGSMEIFELILKAAPELVDIRDSAGCLPIHRAANNSPEMFKRLLEVYPESLHFLTEDNLTLLHVACNGQHGGQVFPEVVKIILEAWPVCMDMRDWYGKTALHFLASSCATPQIVEAVSILLKACPDLANIIDSENQLPYYYAYTAYSGMKVAWQDGDYDDYDLESQKKMIQLIHV